MRKTILLLHGALGSRTQLQPLQEALERDYEVHSINLPGHGGTPMPPDFSISHFADYVYQYVQDNELAGGAVFGYSMGGYVALYLTKKYPGTFSKIVTLATKLCWNEATAAKEVTMLQPQIIEQKLPYFAQALQQRHAPTDWKEVLHQTAGLMQALGRDEGLHDEDWRTIETPVLLLIGDRDKMVTLEETAAVYRQLPAAQLAVLSGTYHPIEGIDIVLLHFLIQRFVP